MARPQKCRRVCATPRCTGFMPAGDSTVTAEHRVSMSVDEYETIRLIDLLGLTQEECAARMEIARTTVTGIYENARHKLADTLVNGKHLIVEGGNYRLCDKAGPGCTGHCCHKEDGRCLKIKSKE